MAGVRYLNIVDVYGGIIEFEDELFEAECSARNKGDVNFVKYLRDEYELKKQNLTLSESQVFVLDKIARGRPE